MGFEINGFDELENELSKLAKNAEQLSETQTVAFDELFSSHFMLRYTTFSTFDEFLEAGNFSNNPEDFEAIPDEELDVHVRKATTFSSWENMLDIATGEYLEKQLGF